MPPFTVCITEGSSRDSSGHSVKSQATSTSFSTTLGPSSRPTRYRERYPVGRQPLTLNGHLVINERVSGVARPRRVGRRSAASWYEERAKERHGS